MVRPEHALHEGSNLLPLLYNPRLPILAKAIVEEAYHEFENIEELLAIEPPKDGMRQFGLAKEVLDRPFFQRPDGCILTAGAFTHRLRNLGLRAGCPRPPVIHHFRAENLQELVRPDLSNPLTILLSS
jgi:hypothetical protein